MRDLAIRNELIKTERAVGPSRELFPENDIAIVGKVEMHGNRADGFDLKVLLSPRMQALLAVEARETGKTRGEILAYLIDLSLYDKN